MIEIIDNFLPEEHYNFLYKEFNDGSPATTNTGGGGGNSFVGTAGGSGGSGIVAIRYRIVAP